MHAEIKNYQYDGKLPFVQMMLNMMVAMGILDRVPMGGIYNRYGQYGMPNNRYAGLWSRGSSWVILTGVMPTGAALIGGSRDGVFYLKIVIRKIITHGLGLRVPRL